MDYESERTRNLGCWNGWQVGTDLIANWEPHSGSNFAPDDQYGNLICDLGFGKKCPADLRKYWVEKFKKNYAGEDGRQRAIMCAVNLKERDGLLARLPYVKCPVLWLHVSTTRLVWFLELQTYEVS